MSDEPIIIPATQENKDALAREAFGMTRDEALADNLCIQCKEPHALERCYSEAGRREYQITAMCEPCFDSMFGEDDDEDDDEDGVPPPFGDGSGDAPTGSIGG